MSEQKNLLCTKCRRFFDGTGDMCPRCRRHHDNHVIGSGNMVTPKTVDVRRMPDANPRDAKS